MNTIDAIAVSIDKLQLQVHNLESQKNTEIAAYAEQLEGCRLSLRQLQIPIARVQNRIAPVSKLSDDVLALVFEAGLERPCFRGIRKEVFKEEQEKLPFAMLASQVSSRWRSVALHNSRLWTTITIDPTYSGLSGLNSLYLERSKFCALDIRLQCYRLPSSSYYSFTIDPSLLPSDRCRYLNITFSSFEQAYDILPLFQDIAMPLLSSLAINFSDLYSDPQYENDWLPEWPVQIFQHGSPLLTHLWLSAISLRSCMSCLERLTSLHLNTHLYVSSQVPYEDFACALLSAANTLKELVLEGPVISFDGLDDNGALKPSSVELPVLLSLEIQFAGSKQLAKFLAVPMLESFTLGYLYGADSGWVMELLGKPRAKTNTGLKSLSLESTLDGNTHLFLARCPDITNLSLPKWSSALQILEIILASDQHTLACRENPLCPHLRMISIVVDDTRNIEYGRQLAQDVIQGRTELGYPLRIEFYKG